jgi:hypothetical protein
MRRDFRKILGNAKAFADTALLGGRLPENDLEPATNLTMN